MSIRRNTHHTHAYTDLIHCPPSLNCSPTLAQLTNNPQAFSWSLPWQRRTRRKLLAGLKVKWSVVKDRVAHIYFIFIYLSICHPLNVYFIFKNTKTIQILKPFLFFIFTEFIFMQFNFNFFLFFVDLGTNNTFFKDEVQL